MKIIGPFTQIISLRNLPNKGTIKDEQLEVLNNAAVVVSQGRVIDLVEFNQSKQQYPNASIQQITTQQVLLPAFVDCHTHICFAGSRADDFAMRLNGESYLAIAKAGGGIWSTVTQTRQATLQELVANTATRAQELLQQGIATAEVKSGYGLNAAQEIKMLRAINLANQQTAIDLIPTFLGAHAKAKDFKGSNQDYLNLLVEEALPTIIKENLSQRADIFIEQSAFFATEAKPYLQHLQQQGFGITIHADQFTTAGSKLATEIGALSADHLEASTSKEVQLLAKSNTVAVALPGASIGLGEPFAPARELLNQGACLAIASDWNPGSAPMGNLLTQASVLATYQKLSMAEVFAAITFRAAKALNTHDIGVINKGFWADFVSFPTNDFKEILYYQGTLKPNMVWKKGKQILGGG